MVIRCLPAPHRVVTVPVGKFRQFFASLITADAHLDTESLSLHMPTTPSFSESFYPLATRFLLAHNMSVAHPLISKAMTNYTWHLVPARVGTDVKCDKHCP